MLPLRTGFSLSNEAGPLRATREIHPHFRTVKPPSERPCMPIVVREKEKKTNNAYAIGERQTGRGSGTTGPGIVDGS